MTADCIQEVLHLHFPQSHGLQNTHAAYYEFIAKHYYNNKGKEVGRTVHERWPCENKNLYNFFSPGIYERKSPSRRRMRRRQDKN
jgi:hypothetical protein